MTPNDILRSIRFLLDINEVGVANLISRGGLEVRLGDIEVYLLREDEPGYVECPDRVLSHLLDGVISELRGARDPSMARPVETRVTNNVVLKKLRVAFMLDDAAILELMDREGVSISKHELSALFRKPEHPNYRACGDQFLRNFLRALTADAARRRESSR